MKREEKIKGFVHIVKNEYCIGKRDIQFTKMVLNYLDHVFILNVMRNIKKKRRKKIKIGNEFFF